MGWYRVISTNHFGSTAYHQEKKENNFLSFEIFFYYFRCVSYPLTNTMYSCTHTLCGVRGLEVERLPLDPVRFPGAAIDLGSFIGPHIRREYWWIFQEAESRGINLSCKNLFPNRCKINRFKPKLMILRMYIFVMLFFLLWDFMQVSKIWGYNYFFVLYYVLFLPERRTSSTIYMYSRPGFQYCQYFDLFISKPFRTISERF